MDEQNSYLPRLDVVYIIQCYQGSKGYVGSSFDIVRGTFKFADQSICTDSPLAHHSYYCHYYYDCGLDFFIDMTLVHYIILF